MALHVCCYSFVCLRCDFAWLCRCRFSAVRFLVVGVFSTRNDISCLKRRYSERAQWLSKRMSEQPVECVYFHLTFLRYFHVHNKQSYKSGPSVACIRGVRAAFFVYPCHMSNLWLITCQWNGNDGTIQSPVYMILNLICAWKLSKLNPINHREYRDTCSNITNAGAKTRRSLPSTVKI